MSMFFTAPFPQKIFLLTMAARAFLMSSPVMVSLLYWSCSIFTDSIAYVTIVGSTSSITSRSAHADNLRFVGVHIVTLNRKA